MQLILPYNIANDTPADAVQVDSNYDVIADYVNSQVINRDGGVSMDAPLLLKGDPTETNHAANKGYIDAFFPIGIILPFGGAGVPAGQWLLCDGSTKSTTTYPTLFNVLGYNYGGTGGNFNVPDMRGRFPIGMDAAQTEFSMVGKKGGTFTVPVPQHQHAMPHTHPIDHDHPVFNTGGDSVNHVHSVAHDHAQFNTGVPGDTHAHVMSARQNSTPGNTGSYMAASSTGTTDATTTGTDADTHIHPVNVPSYAGNSGVESVKHAHSVNVPKHIGASGAVSTTNTANTGTAAVELQPPFTVVNYIIRAS